MTTTTSSVRPVAVEEVRRAWHAVQAGTYRHPTPPLPAVVVPAAAVWVPGVGERVLLVLGAAGSCGATTLALALATASDGAARLVECASVSQSGLAAACTAELGVDELGWRHGSRDRVLVDRADRPRPLLADVPPPSPVVELPVLTVVDAGSDLERLVAGTGWVTGLLTSASMVLVARATVPGLRRLESMLHVLDADRTIAAVLGPPPRRWPSPVWHSLGDHTRRLLDADRLIGLPEDRGLMVRGLTPAPLPKPLLPAAAAVLALTEGLTP